MMKIKKYTEMKYSKKFNESTKDDSKELKDKWAKNNFKKLVKVCEMDIPYEEWEYLVKDKEDFEGVYNSTAKHRALYLLNTHSIDELEQMIKDYNPED